MPSNRNWVPLASLPVGFSELDLNTETRTDKSDYTLPVQRSPSSRHFREAKRVRIGGVARSKTSDLPHGRDVE